MKKIIYLFVFLLSFSNMYSQKLIVDFDNISSIHGGWEGTSTVITNPDKSGINSSDNVCQYTIPAGKAWANAATVVFTDTINYKLLDSIQFMVLAPSATEMFVKLEDGDKVYAQPSAYATPASSSEWQTVTVKFSGISGLDSVNARFDKLVLFFNVNDNTGGEDWLYDNVVVYPTEAAEPIVVEPGVFTGDTILDFEFIPYTIGAWNGASEVVVNPNKSGINVSDSVGKYTTPADLANSHASTVLFLDTINYEMLDSITFQVYGPTASSMYAKLEDEAKKNIEAIAYADVTKENEWEEITLKFTGVSGDDSLYSRYEKITFTFNNQDATGGEDWYFDNVIVYPEEATIPVKKEKPVNGNTVLLSDWDTYMPEWYFNDENNPDLYQISEGTGVDGSTSAKFTTNSSEWNLIMFNYDDGFTWAESGNTFTLKIKAPTEGKVAIKFENDDNSTSIGGGDQTVSTINEYVELTFDLDSDVTAWKLLNPDANIDETFTRMVVFIDMYGTAEGNDWFIDDVYVPKGLVSDEYLSSIHISSSVKHIRTFDNVKLYPNPVNDVLYLEQEENIRILQVYSSTGVLIRTENVESSLHEINLSDLGKGMYLVKLYDYQGTYNTYTIIK